MTKTTKKKLRFAKIPDFSFFSGLSLHDLMEMSKMQMQNNDLIKDLGDFYVAKNKLEEFFKMLLRFLHQNSNFLGNDIKQYKEFQDYFQNIKIGFELYLKNSVGNAPSEQMKTLLNESENLKKKWQERNLPLQETKMENDRILKILEGILAENLYFDKNSELKFQNLTKENISNLEKLLTKAQQKTLDYENFINNYLDNSDFNEGFKNTLKTLIEYKKKVEGMNGLEEELKKIQKDNHLRVSEYLSNFEILEKWFKKHKDIFKDCENMNLSSDAGNAVAIFDKNLKWVLLRFHGLIFYLKPMEGIL